LTSFGARTAVDDLLAQLQDRLDAWTAIARRALDAGLDEQSVTSRLRETMLDELAHVGGPCLAARHETILAAQVSALGLIRYVKNLAPEGIS
jgi:hypothetical protein